MTSLIADLHLCATDSLPVAANRFDGALGQSTSSVARSQFLNAYSRTLVCAYLPQLIHLGLQAFILWFSSICPGTLLSNALFVTSICMVQSLVLQIWLARTWEKALRNRLGAVLLI